MANGARAFVMLPKSEIEGLLKTKTTPNESKLIVEEVKVGADSEVKTAIDSLLDLMPKTYKGRAKSLMTFLLPHLSVDKDTNQLCLVYQGKMYDNLFDLVFYLLLPDNFSSRTSRPIKAYEFLQTLVEMRIPTRLLQSKMKLIRRISKLSVGKTVKRVNKMKSRRR